MSDLLKNKTHEKSFIFGRTFQSGSTQRKAILLILLCTVFTSLGQILWKLGLIQIDFNYPLTLINFPFIMGFFAYGIGFGLMLLAFKDGELSVLYPIVATSYVWVSLFSPILFPDDFMNVEKWLGVMIILISVGLLGIGSSVRNKND